MRRGRLFLAVLSLILIGCQPGGGLSFRALDKSVPRDLGMFSYREPVPAIIVVAQPEDLQQPVIAGNLQLTALLRDLDLNQYFAVLVLHGLSAPEDYVLAVQQVRRQDNQVAVRVRVTELPPQELNNMTSTSPYELVAVSKDGTWGTEITFTLVFGEDTVAESTYYVP